MQPREMRLVGEWRGLRFIQRANAQQCDVMVYKTHSCAVRSPVPKKEALRGWRAPRRAQTSAVQSPRVTRRRLRAAPGSSPLGTHTHAFCCSADTFGKRGEKSVLPLAGDLW